MTQQFLQTGRIANTAVTSDKIANTAITSEKIANTAVTSDKIANSAITVDKVEGSAITSPKLASNLSISLLNVLERANIYSTAVGGNVNIDVLNNTVYLFSSNTSIS